MCACPVCWRFRPCVAVLGLKITTGFFGRDSMMRPAKRKSLSVEINPSPLYKLWTEEDPTHSGWMLFFTRVFAKNLILLGLGLMWLRITNSC